jgi:hypothetical protein
MQAVKAVNLERRRANYLFIMTCDLRLLVSPYKALFLEVLSTM